MTDIDLAGYHIIYTLRDGGGLRLGGVALRRLNEKELVPGDSVLREGGFGNEHLLRSVVHFGGFFGHNLSENEVYRPGDALSASVVAPENYCSGVVFAVKRRPLPAFFKEKLGHRLAETVDALFHVADEKEVAAL